MHFIEHNGGDGREIAAFIENGFVYSLDFNKQIQKLASCFVIADYVINLTLMKDHISQGVTLSA